MSEIHVFTGSAVSLSSATGYSAGERHALMVFLRQPVGSDHDWASAETLVAAESWGEVLLERGGTVGPDSAIGDFSEMYQAALSNGGSIVVYSDPL